MTFIPKATNSTIILKRSYETRDGTFTAGHRFEIQPESFFEHAHGIVSLRDSEGRTITITHYELVRLT